MSREETLLCAYGVLNGIELELWSGSVLKLRTGTIVNAANECLQNNGGLAHQIVLDGGQEIQWECDRYISMHGNLRTASVAVTGGGSLPYNKILHVVGPKLNSGEPVEFRHKDELFSAVFNCMIKANEERFESIGIPAISCGIFMFPIDKASICHIEAFIFYAGTYFTANYQNIRLKKVIFCLYKKDELDLFLSAFMSKWHAFDYVKYLGDREAQNLPKIELTCEICDNIYENGAHLSAYSEKHNHPYKKKVCDFCIWQNQIPDCNICKLPNPEIMTTNFYNYIMCRECKTYQQNNLSHSCRQLCFNCLLQKNQGKTEMEIKCICGGYPYKESSLGTSHY